MPADSDHLRRDALQAARSLIQIEVTKYTRRLYADAKANIEAELAKGEGEVDGTALGFAAARSACENWGFSDPLEAVEAVPVAAAIAANA